ncbi:MAG: DUF559 domain-containing protein [Deltaproteobacteria bacterium]|nr:DUF559 domain-containing protein [Deltaproteobacteria bacterium]
MDDAMKEDTSSGENAVSVIEAILDGIYSDYMVRIERGNLSDLWRYDSWRMYAEKVFDLAEILKPLTERNPFTSGRLLLDVSTEMVQRLEMAVDVAMKSSPDELDRYLAAIASAKDMTTGMWQGIVEEHGPLREELFSDPKILEKIKTLTARRREVSELIDEHYRTMKGKHLEVAARISVLFLNDLLDKYKKCESPLEQAFLLGMVGWSEYYLSHEVTPQYQEAGKRLDFAVFPAKGDADRSYMIDVELDGHTYHEKSEKDAARDRGRDRELTQKGWLVLRFHRLEIERDLRKCIAQLDDTLKAQRGV